MIEAEQPSAEELEATRRKLLESDIETLRNQMRGYSELITGYTEKRDAVAHAIAVLQRDLEREP